MANLSRTLIENGAIWQEDRLHQRSHADRQRRVALASCAPQRKLSRGRATGAWTAGGRYVLPGFVDLHFHGSGGFDVMDASAAALQGICDFVVRQGVTGFLGTTMADARDRIEAALAVMRAFADQAAQSLHWRTSGGSLPQSRFPRLAAGGYICALHSRKSTCPGWIRV